MTRITGGAALVDVLRREGVSHVFGLIGTSLLEVLDVLHEDPDITYVGVRHEQNAVHMADAYARVSGRPGVVLACQPGPGATNLVTGLAQARLAYSPVVAVAGLPASRHIDTDVFQEIDQQALFAPVTKQTRTVRMASRLPEYLDEAFRIAGSGRRGPVVVNVPSDLLAAELDPEPSVRREPSAAPAPAAAAAAAAADLLNAAQRPLIIAGAGVKWSRASEALMELADRLNAPVAASAGHADVVPDDYRLYAGQIGPRGNAVATGLARQADVILALGTRLGFNSTFYSHDNLSPTAKIIQVDVDPAAVGRYFPVELGIVADAGELIGAVLSAIKQGPAREGWVDAFLADRRGLLDRRAAEAAQAAAGGALTPLAVCLAAQRALPRETIVTVDTGTCCMQATDVIQTFGGPGSFLTPVDFGLVGFAYPAGLGAKAAAPGRPVLTIVGDGGFGMSLGEIGTAISAGLPTVTIVMNNGAWGAEKAYQRDFYGGRYVGADLVNPAFDQVARAFGAAGVRAGTGPEVTEAVARALRDDVPAVIEVPVDPDQIISLRRDVFSHRAGG